MTVFFPRSMPRSRRNAKSTPNNAQVRLNLQLNHQLRPRAEDLCARSRGKVLRNWRTRGTGIITPEMEFIAIRENLGREILEERGRLARDRSAPRRTALKSRATICNSAIPARTNRQFGNRQFRKSDHARICPR